MLITSKTEAYVEATFMSCFVRSAFFIEQGAFRPQRPFVFCCISAPQLVVHVLTTWSHCFRHGSVVEVRMCGGIHSYYMVIAALGEFISEYLHFVINVTHVDMTMFHIVFQMVC